MQPGNQCSHVHQGFTENSHSHKGQIRTSQDVTYDTCTRRTDKWQGYVYKHTKQVRKYR